MNTKTTSNIPPVSFEAARAGATKLGEGVHSIGEAVADAATDAVKTISRDAARAADDVSRHVRDAAGSAREAVRETSRGTRNLGEAAMNRVAATGERAQDYVRDEPLKGVLMAAAIGAALTSLIMIATRRR
jgi:ElaB/YqjD/DUF883 family membrane-anchored ribosome-binding protein